MAEEQKQVDQAVNLANIGNCVAYTNGDNGHYLKELFTD